MKNLKKFRYIFLGAIITVILGSTITTTLAAARTKQLNANYNDIKIVIDGAMITPKDANGNVLEPFTVDGTTYLPVRAMCEAIGYNVTWDGNTNTVNVYSTVPEGGLDE